VTKAPMPTARCCLAVVTHAATLYTFGGEIPTSGLNIVFATVEAYDPSTDSWVSKTPMPTPRYYAGAAVLGDIHYVAGGLDSSNHITPVFEAYDPKTNTWINKSPMPTPRSHLALVAADGIIYAIGGVKIGFNNITLDTVEAYDPKTNTWTTMTPMPTPRCCMAAGVIGGLIYVAGGIRFIGHSGSESPSSLEVYDPKSGTWSTKALMTAGVGGTAGGVLAGKLYVVGGALDPLSTDPARKSVEAYDPETNTWATLPAMPTARLSPGVGVVDDTLYAVSGQNRDGSVANVNEAFSPFVHIAIDIKPGDGRNTINLKSQGVVAVAILGSATFDPLTVDPATVTLAGAPVATRRSGQPMASQGDFNHDGYLDLLLHFRTQDLQLTPTSTEAVLYGTTTTGQRIRGADSVRLLSPRVTILSPNKEVPIRRADSRQAVR